MSLVIILLDYQKETGERIEPDGVSRSWKSKPWR
jgi:hypothetical protein